MTLLSLLLQSPAANGLHAFVSNEGLAVGLLVLLPLLGGGFALVVPAEDRLTLRAVGVVFSLLALVPGLWLVGHGGGSLIVPWLPFGLRFTGLALPAALTILGVTPMALRAGAPRVTRGLPSYVTAVLVAEAVSLVAVLADDLVVSVAAATVGAVPFFALVALFGGGERGSVTWRAASLWLLVDGFALGALVVKDHLGAGVDGRVAVAVVVALLGPGLVRLAAGPWGLWALPVLEQSHVAAACLTGGMVAPVGVVVLGRVVEAIAVSPLQPALASSLPALAAVLAIACAIGAALVAAERDLRRIVAHLLGAVGSVAAVVALGDRPLPAVGLVGLTAFSAALCLMLVEAVERRLETRKTTELQGLMSIAPSLGVLLPFSFLALCGLPGPGVAAALWPALSGLVVRGNLTTDVGGLAALLCGASLMVAGVGCAGLVARVGGPPRKGLVAHVRVSLRQGIRLLLPVAALVAASWAAPSVLTVAADSAPSVLTVAADSAAPSVLTVAADSAAPSVLTVAADSAPAQDEAAP